MAERTIGNYQLIEELGSGGMATVYKAVALKDRPDTGIKSGDEVAIKILHPHLARMPEFTRRFAREANVATKLTHPGVARIFEEGTTEQGEPYLVMELARGEKLGDILKEGKPLPVEKIFSIIRQVAEVLEQAREQGIIHRDIKPDNLVIDKEGRAKVLDFGLVRDAEAMSMVSIAISMTGKSIGTPAYMSAEQCRGGKDIDHRSDLYSLGVTGYTLATGRPPFTGPTPTAFIHQHVSEIPPLIEKLNPDMPKGLVQLIYRLMAKSPRDRYQTAGELLEDLERVEKGQKPKVIYRFRKVRHIKPKTVAVAIAATILLVLGTAFGWYYYTTDTARTDVNSAYSEAQQLAGSGEYEKAVDLLKKTVTKNAKRPELISKLEKLRDEYTPKSAEERKIRLAKEIEEKKRQEEAKGQSYEKAFTEGMGYLGKKEYDKALSSFQLAYSHLQDPKAKEQIEKVEKLIEDEKIAQRALAETEGSLKSGEYEKAINKASEVLEKYPNTHYTESILKVKQDAQVKLAEIARQKDERFKENYQKALTYYQQKPPDLNNARFSLQTALKEKDAPDAQNLLKTIDTTINQYEKFISEGKKKLNTGIRQKDKPLILEAKEDFSKAKELWATEEASKLYAQAQESASALKDRLAVVDFQVLGEVGIQDAGKTIAERLLGRLPPDKYELIERMQLVKLLNEKNFQMTDLIDEDKAKEFGKTQGVRYLIYGSINKLKDYEVSARLSDVYTAKIIQKHQVSASDMSDLEKQLEILANVLCMSEEEKRDFFDYPKLLTEANKALEEGKYQDAVKAYERALSAKNTDEARKGLEQAKLKLKEWEAKEEEEKEKDKKFKSLLASARNHNNKEDSGKALKEIDEALNIKPNGTEALALKQELQQKFIPTNMVLVPEGEFVMGSPSGEGENDEHPQHRVWVDAFYIDRYEVTNAEYRRFDSGKKGGNNRPVMNVTWWDAIKYCNWRSKQEGLYPCYDEKTGECDFTKNGYRLPTEAEWEKAARSTDGRRYPWGNERKDGICNTGRQTIFFGTTAPVGSYPQSVSPYGCHDMAGNVWEWCNDWYDENYYKNSPNNNPKGPNSGSHRIFRGGSWNYFAYDSRTANRDRDGPGESGNGPGVRNHSHGFRCARTP